MGLKIRRELKLREKKLNFIEESTVKIKMIRQGLYKAKYHSIYEVRSEEFLNEMERQVYKNGSLSVKQRTALNQMHRRFNKRIENKA